MPELTATKIRLRKKKHNIKLDREIKMNFETTEKKVCYGLGYQFGRQLAPNLHAFPDFSIEALMEGIKDYLCQNELQVDKGELNKAFAEIQAQMDSQAKEFEADQKKLEEQFLEENRNKSGVVETASGLQYEVLVEGRGEKPGLKDIVKVHYHGTLPNGDVFDSSVKRGEPAEFPVNGVIKGWVEALQLMNVGSKFRLVIPYRLAYGEQGAGGSIPPFQTLVFEVELLDIVMKAKN